MRPARFGFHVALVASVASIAFGIVQILQVVGALPRPLDEILIYATSLGIATPYVLAMVALHHVTDGDRRLWTLAALASAVMYAVYVTLNYVVQLSTVIRVLDQTPHSLFWDIDALGYIFLAFSTVFGALALDARERWLRGFLIANGAVTPLVALVYFYPHFSITLLLVATPWIITVLGALVLLTRHFYLLRSAPSLA